MKEVYEVNYECVKNIILTQAIAIVRASVWSPWRIKQVTSQAEKLWMTGANQGMNVLCQLIIVTKCWPSFLLAINLCVSNLHKKISMVNLINIYMCKPNKQLQYACPLKIREILMPTYYNLISASASRIIYSLKRIYIDT